MKILKNKYLNVKSYSAFNIKSKNKQSLSKRKIKEGRSEKEENQLKNKLIIKEAIPSLFMKLTNNWRHAKVMLKKINITIGFDLFFYGAGLWRG